MEILTFIVGVVIVGFLFLVFRESRPERKIAHFEGKAADFIELFRSTHAFLYGSRELPDEVSLMEDFYIRVCEHFRHDPSQIVKCSEDRMNYILIKNSENMRWNDMVEAESDAAREQHSEERREASAKAEEIENRFAQYLGEDARKRLSDLREKQERKAAEFWGKFETSAPGTA